MTTLTQAVTELLCTSSPQQRSTILFISLPSTDRQLPSPMGASSTKSLVYVLSRATVRGAFKRLPRHTFLRALCVRHQAPPTSARRRLHFHGVGVARPGPWGTFLKASCSCVSAFSCRGRPVFSFTLRQRLSRFVRKTLSFSKSRQMHHCCLKLFICRYNLERRSIILG